MRIATPTPRIAMQTPGMLKLNIVSCTYRHIYTCSYANMYRRICIRIIRLCEIPYITRSISSPSFPLHLVLSPSSPALFSFPFHPPSAPSFPSTSPAYHLPPPPLLFSFHPLLCPLSSTPSPTSTSSATSTHSRAGGFTTTAT